MSVVVTLALCTLAVLLSIFLGDIIGRGKRELFDETSRDDPDGLSLGGTDNLKSSFHEAGDTQ